MPIPMNFVSMSCHYIMEENKFQIKTETWTQPMRAHNLAQAQDIGK